MKVADIKVKPITVSENSSVYDAIVALFLSDVRTLTKLLVKLGESQ